MTDRRLSKDGRDIRIKKKYDGQTTVREEKIKAVLRD